MLVLPDDLLAGLGVSEMIWCGRTRFDIFLEVANAKIVRNLEPDFRLLGNVDARGIIVTASGGETGYDFVSRFFAPQSGIDEDPVTGSAHCALGPYWAGKTGLNDFQAIQISERSGEVEVKLVGDRTYLGGHAVTVVKGELI